MNRGSGSFVVLLVSWFYVFVSFHRLWRERLYKKFFVTLAVFSFLGLFIYAGLLWSFSLGSGDLRVWAVAPFVFLALGFLLSGFFLRRYVEDRIRGAIARDRVSPSTRVRIAGAFLSTVGVAIWVYGIVHPISGTPFIVALIVSLYCMLFGFPYLIAGKKIGDID
jgi:hypothetical protein